MKNTSVRMSFALSVATLAICAIYSTAEARLDRYADQYGYDRESSHDQSSRMNRDNDWSMREGRSSQDRDRDRYHWKQLTGEIERVKKVNVRGTQQDHLAALVFTDRGNRVVADLGPAKQLRDLELQSGDRISARGPVFRINDRLVMFAEHIRANGQTIKIQQQDPWQRGRSMEAQSDQPNSQRSAQFDQQTKQVSGQVKDVKELQVKGMNKMHQVVRLQTEDGKQIFADLGTKKDLRDLKIASGQQVTIHGKPLIVGGKPFLLANQVSSDGRTAQIDRTMLSAIPALWGAQEAQRGTQSISGEVIVKGEVLKVDRDGFYIVKDEQGRDVHMIVSESMNRGINVGDYIQAQVQPDGTVTSIARSTENSSGSDRRSSGRSAQMREEESNEQ